MLWGDVELCQTSRGQEYLAFSEKQGMEYLQAFFPKIFAPPGRCQGLFSKKT